MNYEAYPFSRNEQNNSFQFQSTGKRGTFEKAIAFSLITDNIYNLALLDFNPLMQDYTDDSITDNGDMPEIMATVMAVAIDYLNDFPDRRIYLTGNTASRTRLYQIAISKVLKSISQYVTVLGYYNDLWIPFEPNMNFEGFLVTKNFID